jgi:DNA polymerase-3 subunit delta
MPTQSFDALSRLIRSGEIPPAVYLFGEEDVLKDEVIRAILDRVLDPALRDFNYDQRTAVQLDPEAVETLCDTLPMMADRRVVVIREVEAWSKRAPGKAAMLRYLEKPAPETVVVLVQGAARGGENERGGDRNAADTDLARVTCAVEVGRYGPKLAEKWLMKRAEERGVRFEPDAAAHFVKVMDGDLGLARSELDKLAGLGGETPVTLAQVTALLGVRHGETQADWCEAVLHAETARAARILPHLLAQTGVSGVGLVTLLGTQLVGLGLARAQYDRGLRADALQRAVFGAILRARPPRLDYRGSAERWSRLAEHWPLGRVDAAVRGALRADRRLKGTSLADERGVLLDLVMELAYGAGAAA